MQKYGKIVEVFTATRGKKKIEIVVRYPKKSDLRSIYIFDNAVRRETPYLDIIKPIKFSDDKKWFLDILDRIKKKTCVYLIAEHNGKMVGACTVRQQKEDTYPHVGVYDNVVSKKYWKLGIGSALTKNILEIARKEMKLEIIRLILYSGNRGGEKLYRKFGFAVAGKIPNGVKRGRRYMDEIIMYKVIK